jgi:hypothetical protein
MGCPVEKSFLLLQVAIECWMVKKKERGEVMQQLMMELLGLDLDWPSKFESHLIGHPTPSRSRRHQPSQLVDLIADWQYIS